MDRWQCTSSEHLRNALIEMQNLVLLKTRSTPLGPRLPSPTMLLFNCIIRNIMPIINRSTINGEKDDNNYEEIVAIQHKGGKKYDDLRISNSIPIVPTVALQCKDRGLWTNGKIIDKRNYNYNEQSYRMHIKKTGWLITRNSKYVNAMPFIMVQYIRDQLSKDRHTDTLGDISKHFKKPFTIRQ